MIESAEEFRRLRESENIEEYTRAAEDEAPTEVWLAVIHSFSDMRQWVAHNKTVPIEILTLLSDDPDVDVRFVVASKRKLPEALQLKLAKDENMSVRQRVALNPKARRTALEILAKDPEFMVREVAARRLKEFK